MASAKTNGQSMEPEWARGPVVSGPAWQRILKAIYNPDDKSFLGRTARRWGIVLVFYLVFYAVLALLFGLCMGGLFYSIDLNKPTYILGESLIGKNPGVAYRPLPDDGFLLTYDRNNATQYKTYVKQLTEFLEPYPTADLPSCTANDSFGYPDTPCVFIKLNKIYGWEPDYYSDQSSLPADMPEDLVEHIKEADNPEKGKQIWVSCYQEGDNTTLLEYPWGRSLPGTKYPYLLQDSYLSPVVAVRLVPSANTRVIIRCRAWAKNIIYNKSIKEGSGYTRIMVSIEDHTTEDKALAEN